uniref:Cilia- and flagella-associated protein 300 n=1 Tax=Phallusia mammillata TaxID=59560 RepID=A0A6F9D9X8_9ASCI|nr:uncharacterized protein C11orf70 homolog [Phallusia mammillata]
MDDETPFKFTFLPKQLPTLCNKDFRTYFEKWYLLDRLKAWTFSFDKPYQHYKSKEFLTDLLKDESVLQNIQIMGDSGSWGRMDSPSSVDIEQLKCSVTSMDFFDKLKKEGIVRENGSICKCFDEMYEGITISDELRKMILMEDSDNFESYSDDERLELIFKIFSHLVVGGPICQYEDNVQAYYDVTKSLYKDLVCVQKHAETKELVVKSEAYKVTAKDKSGTLMFPSTDEHEQTFAYVTIDPIKRHATILYHCWGKGLW